MSESKSLQAAYDAIECRRLAEHARIDQRLREEHDAIDQRERAEYARIARRTRRLVLIGCTPLALVCVWWLILLVSR